MTNSLPQKNDPNKSPENFDLSNDSNEERLSNVTPLSDLKDLDFIEEENPLLDDDPVEPGKTETLGRASGNALIDKWIGRDLKPPPVQDDGHW